MKTPIHKTTLTVVVYSRTPLEVDGCSLPSLAEAIDDPDIIGGVEIQERTTITTSDLVLEKELVDIGNGPEFFDFDPSERAVL